MTYVFFMGMLLGLHCDRPAREVQGALLQHDTLTGLCADPEVLCLTPPLAGQEALRGSAATLSRGLAAAEPGDVGLSAENQQAQDGQVSRAGGHGALLGL